MRSLNDARRARILSRRCLRVRRRFSSRIRIRSWREYLGCLVYSSPIVRSQYVVFVCGWADWVGGWSCVVVPRQVVTTHTNTTENVTTTMAVAHAINQNITTPE